MVKIYTLFLALIASNLFAATYYVDQNGAGKADGSSWANRASLKNFEAGKGPFANLDGDTVCFGGALSSGGNELDIDGADDQGANGNYIVLDGSGAGDCSEVPIPASIFVGDGSYGIDAVDPAYLKVNGFTITNGPSTGGHGIKFSCPDNDICHNIYVTNNDISVYGEKKSNQSYGIVFLGGFQDIFIQDNKVAALNAEAYNGVNVKTNETHSGHLKRISISGNIVSNFAHSNITVQNLDSGSSIEYLFVYDNFTTNSDRGYGRPFGLATVDIKNAKYIYIHDNTFTWQRGGIQFGGTWVSFYRNIISVSRNQCGPKNPAEYNPKHAGEEPYYGDSDCVESCVYGSCTESDSWGAAMGYGKGLGLYVGHAGGADDYAVFQNTFYDLAESAVQLRNSGSSASNRSIHAKGNIFLKDSQFNKGTWGNFVGGARPYLNAPGDSNPPGSISKDSDCTFFVKNTGKSNLIDMQIKQNIWYTEGVFQVFCSGGAMYSQKDAESKFFNSYLSIDNNKNEDPKLKDPDNGDFTLQPDSIAIDVGFWTKITSPNGSAKSFKVENALFLGNPGELIKTESGQTGVIQSISYVKNGDDIVTLASSISWTKDEGIGLFFTGNSLDAGAKEFNHDTNKLGSITSPLNLKVIN